MNQTAIRKPYRPEAARFRFTPGQSAVLAVSIVAGFAYPMMEGRIGPILDIAAKTVCVAALALVAAMARQWWLAAIMAAGALGDLLLELRGGLVPGGAAFAVGHVMAIRLYLGLRVPGPPMALRVMAAALILYGLLMPWLVLPGGSDIAAVTLYAVLLCSMAAAALISRFPGQRYPRRWLVTGALLFIISDTLLIMRMGGRLIGSDTVHGGLVWYSYYAAQLLIFLGVINGRRRR